MKWADEEVDFLKVNYDRKIPLEEISNKLNRSLKSVKRKAQNLNLHRPWVRFSKPTSKQSKNIIDKRYYEKNKEEIYRRKMNRRKKLKEEAIKISGGKCSVCGYDRCLSALEFHHNHENKEGHVSTFIKKGSRQKVLKEAKKCILLCANCHRELHYKGSVV